MKVKMYGYAWKDRDGVTVGRSYDDKYDRDERAQDHRVEYPEDRVGVFTFTLDLDPAAMFPVEPEFAAGAVEVE
jgi:hypothetical protein